MIYSLEKLSAECEQKIPVAKMQMRNYMQEKVLE